MKRLWQAIKEDFLYNTLVDGTKIRRHRDWYVRVALIFLIFVVMITVSIVSHQP